MKKRMCQFLLNLLGLRFCFFQMVGLQHMKEQVVVGGWEAQAPAPAGSEMRALWLCSRFQP